MKNNMAEDAVLKQKILLLIYDIKLFFFNEQTPSWMQKRPIMPRYHWAEYVSICQMLLRKVKIWITSRYSSIIAGLLHDVISRKLQWKHGWQGAITICNNFHHLDSLGFFICYTGHTYENYKLKEFLLQFVWGSSIIFHKLPLLICNVVRYVYLGNAGV